VKRALVLGAGGFIGGHLVRRLKDDGYWVSAVGRSPGYFGLMADEFWTADLRDDVLPLAEFDEVYQMAADMGGIGYLLGGNHNFSLMSSSMQINLNVARWAAEAKPGRLFFASSACVYPADAGPELTEAEAYPALPDNEYGWEKLFAERLYANLAHEHGVEVRIGRLHTVFGPYGTWRGGKEKVIAAICRKIAEAPDGGVVEVWGDGEQARSFLYVDEAVEAIRRLTASTWSGPMNIGSDEMVTINDLVRLIAKIAGKNVRLRHVTGPQGVRERNCDNYLIEHWLEWKPSARLIDGLKPTYDWIAEQIESVMEPV
jgi:nucleoside-diphosphate-sugar epimerase